MQKKHLTTLIVLLAGLLILELALFAFFGLEIKEDEFDDQVTIYEYLRAEESSFLMNNRKESYANVYVDINASFSDNVLIYFSNSKTYGDHAARINVYTIYLYYLKGFNLPNSNPVYYTTSKEQFFFDILKTEINTSPQEYFDNLVIPVMLGYLSFDNQTGTIIHGEANFDPDFNEIITMGEDLSLVTTKSFQMNFSFSAVFPQGDCLSFPALFRHTYVVEVDSNKRVSEIIFAGELIDFETKDNKYYFSLNTLEPDSDKRFIQICFD